MRMFYFKLVSWRRGLSVMYYILKRPEKRKRSAIFWSLGDFRKHDTLNTVGNSFTVGVDTIASNEESEQLYAEIAPSFHLNRLTHA